MFIEISLLVCLWMWVILFSDSVCVGIDLVVFYLVLFKLVILEELGKVIDMVLYSVLVCFGV